MEGGLDLLGGVGGGGGGDGGVSLGGESTNGSSSTVSSEVSSYPTEADLELGLGLSLGGVAVKAKPLIWGDYGRILTANEFPSKVSGGSSASSSCSSVKANASSATGAGAGTKRAADSIAQEEGAVHGVSQVVGWPPIRAFRMNSLVNQTKVPDAKEGDNMVVENSKNNDDLKKTTSTINNKSKVQEKVHIGNSLLVKVNMDGVPIGRKVDLNVHACYETLSQTLEEMFHGPTTNSICTNREKEHGVEAAKPSKLLDGSSEFVLTYEDKEGDLMLVGDVPWGLGNRRSAVLRIQNQIFMGNHSFVSRGEQIYGFRACHVRMFLNTVKRLRIMRTSEANGLAPRFQDGSRRQRTKPI